MIASKKISLVSFLVSCLALHAHAHAAIAPALGVQGTPVRADVQRPSTAEPCGTIPVSDINTSTAVPLGADGSADFTVTNFNAGTDGSREVTAEVDPTGTGKSFQAATVTTNGDGDPTNVGSQPLVVQLPAGIKCTGGTSGDLCLMSFKTTSGFGNCAVVSQGATATGAAKAATAATGGAAAAKAGAADAKSGAADAKSDAASATPAAAAKDAEDAVSATPAAAKTEDAAAAKATGDAKKGKGKGKGEHKGKGKGKGKGKAAAAKTANTPAGARAARSVLAASGGDMLAKRGSWIWA